MLRAVLHESPLGSILLTARGERLAGLHFVGQKYYPSAPAPREATPSGVLDEARRQLDRYFAGRLDAFELPLDPEGTPFQRRVWAEIARIPHGATATYGALAARLGCPSARAIGAATGRNPLSIVVPCHRVVGSARGLTGYAGGLERKAALLALEAEALSAARPRPAPYAWPQSPSL